MGRFVLTRGHELPQTIPAQCFCIIELVGGDRFLQAPPRANQENGARSRGCRKEINKIGALNTIKAFERLAILNEANEKALLLTTALSYHKPKGSTKYSIDADSRESPWRITF